MREAEILVIGGGIAGVCAAYCLARHGRQVALLEQGRSLKETARILSVSRNTLRRRLREGGHWPREGSPPAPASPSR